MKILKILLLLAVIAIVLFVAIGFFLPTSYDVTRSVVINATPEEIHAYVGDLKKWEEWGPWKDEDPTIETTYGDKTTGVGAHQSWTSKEGPGQLTFTKVDPSTGVEFDMAFGEGDAQMSSKGWLKYEKVEGGTKVTWGMKGELDMAVVGGYIASAMDSMAGPNFERGLNKLKAKAEAGS